MSTPDQDQGDLHAKLWRLWHLVLDSLTEYFEKVPPEKQSAFMHVAATRFLKLNDVRFSAHNKAQQVSALRTLKGIDLPFE